MELYLRIGWRMDEMMGANFRCRSLANSVLGVQKSDGVPEHEIPEQVNKKQWRDGDKESLKVCTHLKSYESLYMFPRAPIYTETKGLLHSEITLESIEYS
jgi:hypothetical protein